MSKKVKILFTFSLILNVLFLSMVAGHFFHQSGEGRPWDETKAMLAPETREVMNVAFKKNKGEIVSFFGEAHKNKEAMKALLSAPEFDGAAYDVMAEKLEVFSGQMMGHRVSVIKEIFSQLPQEERLKMAGHTVDKMLGKPPVRHGRDGGKHHYDKKEEGRVDFVSGIRSADFIDEDEEWANQWGCNWLILDECWL